MFKLLWELFLFYLLYKFIFGLVIPVYRTTRQVKKQMNQFEQRYREEQKAHAPQHQAYQQDGSKSTQPKSDHDYIEFEEVR